MVEIYKSDVDADGHMGWSSKEVGSKDELDLKKIATMSNSE